MSSRPVAQEHSHHLQSGDMRVTRRVKNCAPHFSQPSQFAAFFSFGTRVCNRLNRGIILPRAIFVRGVVAERILGTKRLVVSFEQTPKAGCSQMAGPSPKPNEFISLNFAFLTKHDEVLVRHAALAVRYVIDDPNSALLKLRQFSELLTRDTAASTGIAPQVRESQVAASPAEVLAAVVQVSQHEPDELDLDEAATRHIIDVQLRDVGWEAGTRALKYAAGTRPIKGRNLAIAEWPMSNGPADYVLFVGLTPITVVEAKRKCRGQTQTEVRRWRNRAIQAIQPRIPSRVKPCVPRWSVGGLQRAIPVRDQRRPYLRQIAEKRGIWFHDAREETNHPRALEARYTPEGLKGLLKQDIEAADARLEAEPTDYLPLRDYQADAVRSVERGIAEGNRELLVATATGTGKTITCIGLIYRLIKTKRFRRILFLVDRTMLGEQAADKLKDVRLEDLQAFPRTGSCCRSRSP